MWATWSLSTAAGVAGALTSGLRRSRRSAASAQRVSVGDCSSSAGSLSAMAESLGLRLSLDSVGGLLRVMAMLLVVVRVSYTDKRRPRTARSTPARPSSAAAPPPWPFAATAEMLRCRSQPTWLPAGVGYKMAWLQRHYTVLWRRHQGLCSTAGGPAYCRQSWLRRPPFRRGRGLRTVRGLWGPHTLSAASPAVPGVVLQGEGQPPPQHLPQRREPAPVRAVGAPSFPRLGEP